MWESKQGLLLGLRPLDSLPCVLMLNIINSSILIFMQCQTQMIGSETLGVICYTGFPQTVMAGFIHPIY